MKLRRYNYQYDDCRIQVTFGVIEKLVFDVSYVKMGLTVSHFSTHRYTINLFVIVISKWKTGKCKTSSTHGVVFPTAWFFLQNLFW